MGFNSVFKWLNWKEHIAKKKTKKKQIDLKTKEINWLIKKIPSIYRKQITHLQSSNQTEMELRNRTVGLRQQVQNSIMRRSQSKILRAIKMHPAM